MYLKTKNEHLLVAIVTNQRKCEVLRERCVKAKRKSLGEQIASHNTPQKFAPERMEGLNSRAFQDVLFLETLSLELQTRTA